MRVRLAAVILGIVLVFGAAAPGVSSGHPSRGVAPYSLVGGTWTDARVGLVGTAFAVDTPRFDSLWLEISGPAGTLRCGGYAPPGASRTRTLCWERLRAVSGTYVARPDPASWTSETASVAIDAGSRVTPPRITALRATTTGVRVEWSAGTPAASYLVRLNHDPWDRSVVHEVLTGPTARSHSIAGLNLTPGTRYQISVFAFTTDLFGAATAAPFNVGSDSREFTASNCAPYIVVGSRGSGERAGTLGAPNQRLADALRRRLGRDYVGTIANRYPAVGGWINMFGALQRIAALGAYHGSVTDGKRWLVAKIRELRRTCRSSKLVLAGYSQGAQVTADVVQRHLNADDRRGILGTVLFGDPYFNGNDHGAGRGGYLRGRHGRLAWYGIAGTRLRVPNPRPRFSSGFVRSYCHRNDTVCQNTSLLDFLRYRLSQHSNYDTSGEPEAAANAIANLGLSLLRTRDAPV